MADALGIDDENFPKLLPVACRLSIQIAFYIMGFFAYPPIRYISALYAGVAHEARGNLR